MDEQDIADLVAICNRAEAALADGTFEVGLSTEFHVRLARATHNRAVELMTDALQGPLLASLQRVRAVAPQMGDRGVLKHREIVDGVGERDVERAMSVMSRHLKCTAQRLRGATPSVADEAGG